MPSMLLSRRALLKGAGVALVASALAPAEVGCAAPQAQTPAVETPAYAYGKEHAAAKRILVAYATRTGSTVGVAAAIGEALAGRGFAVDVKPLKSDPSTEGYATVVLGSAINGGQWLPEAVAYAKSNQAALQRVPVALFCVHIMNLGEDEKSRKNRLAYLNAVRPLLKPVEEGFFAGLGMDPATQGALVRWFYRAAKIGPEGDNRDWAKIRAWAGELAEKLAL